MKIRFHDWRLTEAFPLDVIVRGQDKPFRDVRRNSYRDFHEAIHVIALLRGDMYMTCGVTPFHLHEGDFLVTAPYEVHHNFASDGGNTHMTLTVDPNLLGHSLIGASGRLDHLFTLSPEKRMSLLLTEELRASCRLCAGRLMELSKEDILRRWHALLGFFIEVVSHVPSAPLPEKRAGNYSRLLPAFRLLPDAKGRYISATEGALACSLSLSRFRFLFRECTGMPFASYEQDFRFRSAAYEIVFEERSIKEAASGWGFCDGSHFSHLFRKRFGCSPGRLRSKYGIGRLMELSRPRGE